MVAMNPDTPILVGAGQCRHHLRDLDDITEPVDLMLRACRIAEKDTTVSLLHKVQSVRVIRGIWRYGNPAAWISDQIGAGNAETVGTLYGGNYNQVMVNDAAEDISRGKLDLVLITGAEVGYTLAKLQKAGREFCFRELPGDYDWLVSTSQMPEHHEYEVANGIGSAIQVYPLYENAIRYQRGETLPEHMARVSELWSRFSAVAAGNPHAWMRERVSAGTIATPSPANRRVSLPYTKLMNANNAVDMGAALILCSVTRAQSLGIPRDKWVFIHAGVEGRDHFSASVRDNFHSSPAIRIAGRQLFEMTGTDPAGLDFVDIYSCFPSAVQIAAKELGLPETRPLTVTGGLTFGGGPLNNYVMHSIARMAEWLRESPNARGLITANGGNLYKQALAIYSATPPARDFRRVNVQEEIDALPGRTCLPDYQGRVTIESCTVMYGAEGPAVAHFSCLTNKGERVWANSDDVDLMRAMETEEFCGRSAMLDKTIRIDG